MKNNFENPFNEEEEREIAEMERKRIEASDAFKERGVSYKRKPANHRRITDKEAEAIIAAMEKEKAEEAAKEIAKLQEERSRQIEESREDQKDDINDLYRR
ncbi:MAG: hypothetical protein K9M44_03755 [Candidatus Pacebacteria bacterium]|nr:hypothetical protein [Candidatus Paceibacterota bacterium]